MWRAVRASCGSYLLPTNIDQPKVTTRVQWQVDFFPFDAPSAFP